MRAPLAGVVVQKLVLPGQFIQVHFQYADGSPARRSFSVSQVGDRLEAHGTDKLSRAEIGDYLGMTVETLRRVYGHHAHRR